MSDSTQSPQGSTVKITQTTYFSAIPVAAVFSSTLGVTGNFAVNTNKFTVTAASGNTAVAGTFAVTGTSTFTGAVGAGAAPGTEALRVSGTNMVGRGQVSVVGTGTDDARISFYNAASAGLYVGASQTTVTFEAANNQAWSFLGSGAATFAGALNVTGNVAVNTNKFTVTASNGNTLVAGTLNVTGTVTFTTLLADSNLATISTAGKVANSATTATSANTASAIVARDASGNFSAGTITATTLAGTLSTAAQPNVTSLGTLTSLTVSGTTTLGNVVYTGNPSTIKSGGANGIQWLSSASVGLLQLYDSGIFFGKGVAYTGGATGGDWVIHSANYLQSDNVAGNANIALVRADGSNRVELDGGGAGVRIGGNPGVISTASANGLAIRSSGGSVNLQMYDAGYVFTRGVGTTTGMSAGDLTLPNGNNTQGLRVVNAAGTNCDLMFGYDSSNNMRFGSGVAGSIQPQVTFDLASGQQVLKIQNLTNASLPAAGAVNNQLVIDSTNAWLVYYIGGARYKLVGTSF